MQGRALAVLTAAAVATGVAAQQCGGNNQPTTGADCESCIADSACAWCPSNSSCFQENDCSVTDHTCNPCFPYCSRSDCRVSTLGTCKVSAQDMQLIIGISVAVGLVVVVVCVIYWYMRCSRDAASRRYSRYERDVKKQKRKLQERADERTTKRQEREAEIRGKYALWKNKETNDKAPLLEEGGASGPRY